MAVRNVDTNLWNDGLIMDNFGMVEKYFWLFLLTTRYGNLSGCFEITQKQIQLDASLTAKQVEDLITAFIKLKLIDYDFSTNEILIVNYLKYNFNRSPLFKKSIEKQVVKIKNNSFRDYISNILESDRELIVYRYGIDTVSIPYKDKDKDNNKEKVKIKVKDKDKKPYGEFHNVLLTDEEFEKLKKWFLIDYEEYIEKLSLYIESKKVKYNSHYATIRQWLKRDGKVAEEIIIAEFDENGDLING